MNNKEYYSWPYKNNKFINRAGHGKTYKNIIQIKVSKVTE